MATAGAVETDPPLDDDETRPLHEVIDPEGFFLPHPWGPPVPSGSAGGAVCERLNGL